MKSIVKLNLLIIIFISAITVNAQTKVKLGYVNSDSLMLIMPGVDSANQVLQLEYKTYQSQLTTMQTELNTKYQDYQTNLSTMSELIKQTKMAELQDINTRIESFTASADTAFQTKKLELFKPIQDKALKAIEEVAKENGYTYIFDSAVGILLYKSESDNLMPLVKKKIGIK
ncbi:MAG TPA: OmpH family outer membrane protein [Bacteroidales bacterium]|nr:OmpH family outer membrane protein [Bacteroidales bacterium]